MIRTVAITREALTERPDVIFDAIRTLAQGADFRNPAPVTIIRCPGHPNDIVTVSSTREQCLIHLSQEQYR
jgi:hypothetical protein